jgi:Cu2+-exporting ATPase
LSDIEVRAGTTQAQALAQAVALARHSLHPLSRALLQAEASRWAGTEEGVPVVLFCDGVVESAGQGVCGQVRHGNGSGGEIRLGSAAFCGVANRPAPNVQVHLADPQGWLATFSLKEDVRPDAQQAVAALQSAGIGVYLLSGDGVDSVKHIAQQVGILHAQGGCTPGDKLQALQKLQALGHTVAMVGDGLNDGPVLAGAHVSFAFGQAVPLAQAQADFVVMGNSLLSVVQSVRLASDTMRIVRQNLWWALLYNAACVPLAVLGWLPAWLAGLGMATSSLVVVLNALRLSKNRLGLTVAKHLEL